MEGRPLWSPSYGRRIRGTAAGTHKGCPYNLRSSTPTETPRHPNVIVPPEACRTRHHGVFKRPGRRPGTIRLGRTQTRRRLLATGASATAIASLDSFASPFLSRAADRPLVTHGVQSGDVDLDDRALWSVRLEPHA